MPTTREKAVLLPFYCHIIIVCLCTQQPRTRTTELSHNNRALVLQSCHTVVIKLEKNGQKLYRKKNTALSTISSKAVTQDYFRRDESV